jgi:hypothetical protein
MARLVALQQLGLGHPPRTLEGIALRTPGGTRDRPGGQPAATRAVWLRRLYHALTLQASVLAGP